MTEHKWNNGKCTGCGYSLTDDDKWSLCPLSNSTPNNTNSEWERKKEKIISELRRKVEETLDEHFPKIEEEGEEKRRNRRGAALVLYADAIMSATEAVEEARREAFGEAEEIMVKEIRHFDAGDHYGTWTKTGAVFGLRHALDALRAKAEEEKHGVL